MVDKVGVRERIHWGCGTASWRKTFMRGKTIVREEIAIERGCFKRVDGGCKVYDLVCLVADVTSILISSFKSFFAHS